MIPNGTGSFTYLGADPRSCEKRPKTAKMPPKRKSKDMMSAPPKPKRKK